MARRAVAGGGSALISVLAHGIGDASLLPVPLPSALLLAGALVLGAAAWRRRTAAPGAAGPRVAAPPGRGPAAEEDRRPGAGPRTGPARATADVAAAGGAGAAGAAAVTLPPEPARSAGATGAGAGVAEAAGASRGGSVPPGAGGSAAAGGAGAAGASRGGLVPPGARGPGGRTGHRAANGACGETSARGRTAGGPGAGTGAGGPARGERAADERGVALPAWVTALVDARATRAVLRALGLVLGAAVLALAVAGPAQLDRNPAPRLFLVLGWAGLVPLSLVAPGAWRAVNPLRAVTAVLARVSGDAREEGVRPLPERLGWWPGAVALAVLAVVEGPLGGTPTALLIFLVPYVLVQVAAAAVYGSAWYRHGEAFEILAAVVGRLSPVARRPDGRLGLSSPLPRLAAPLPPGGVAVLGVLVGAALADFAGDTARWQRLVLGRPAGVEAALDLALLAAGTLLAAGLVAAGGRPRSLLPALSAVVPGYLAAHYFAVLLLEGQAGLSQVGNLLAGRPEAELAVRYELLPGALAASLQLAGFLVPHVLAALAATDVAVARYGPRRAATASAAVVGVVALSAVAGTALRYAAA